MTIEEKAKAYDMALEIAKAWYKLDNNNLSNDDLEKLFPELKESEDERMRKELIAFLKTYKTLSTSRYISWLEKQCEEKANSKGKSALEAINEVKLDNANKIEPKFKIGDWITNGACTIQITSVDGKYYWHNNDCVGGDIESIDKEYHLWTINDAKNGDVLFHSDSASNGIFIFKELLKYEFGEKVICYCDYDSEDHFCFGEHHTCCWADAKILHPATKEQRDNLFKKINEAGYVWYPNSKELYKLIRIHYD